jgi:hypothetical protein
VGENSRIELMELRRTADGARISIVKLLDGQMRGPLLFPPVIQDKAKKGRIISILISWAPFVIFGDGQ